MGSKQIENHWSRLERHLWDQLALEQRRERPSPKLGATFGLMDPEAWVWVITSRTPIFPWWDDRPGGPE